MTSDPTACGRCSQPHGDRCKAHRKDGGPCGRWPMVGQAICYKHGANAGQNLAAAARRLADRQALLAVETFGLPVKVDATTALLDELYRTVGAVEWLGAVVADLERSDVVWGMTRTKEGGDDAGVTHEAKPSAWVVLWHAERRHLVEVSKACIAAGIEERRVRLAESQGALLAGVIRGTLEAMFAALLEAMDRDPNQVDGAASMLLQDRWPVLVGEIVPAQLRAVALEGGEA